MTKRDILFSTIFNNLWLNRSGEAEGNRVTLTSRASEHWNINATWNTKVILFRRSFNLLQIEENLHKNTSKTNDSVIDYIKKKNLVFKVKIGYNQTVKLRIVTFESCQAFHRNRFTRPIKSLSRFITWTFSICPTCSQVYNILNVCQTTVWSNLITFSYKKSRVF